MLCPGVLDRYSDLFKKASQMVNLEQFKKEELSKAVHCDMHGIRIALAASASITRALARLSMMDDREFLSCGCRCAKLEFSSSFRLTRTRMCKTYTSNSFNPRRSRSRLFKADSLGEASEEAVAPSSHAPPPLDRSRPPRLAENSTCVRAD